MVKSKQKRVSSDFERFVNNFRKNYKKTCGGNLSFPEATEVIARLNRDTMVVIIKRKKKKRHEFKEIFPF